MGLKKTEKIEIFLTGVWHCVIMRLTLIWHKWRPLHALLHDVVGKKSYHLRRTVIERRVKQRLGHVQDPTDTIFRRSTDKSV